MAPEEFVAKTEFGKFRIKINSDFISVGGKRFCVQIVYRNEKDIELTSLETKYGGCEIDNKEIQGELTVHMIHLAFTILKEKYKTAKTVNLMDTSSFMCDGRPMGLMKTSLLLYGATYYERKFGAKPQFISDEKSITEFKYNWAKLQLPDKFHFNNLELAEILSPIYRNCTTWAEFALKLNEKFGRKVCKYIYPWFLYANREIYAGTITEFWKIDIEDKCSVPYERLKLSGGNRRTLKNVVYHTVYRPAWDGYGIFDLIYS